MNAIGVKAVSSPLSSPGVVVFTAGAAAVFYCVKVSFSPVGGASEGEDRAGRMKAG